MKLDAATWNAHYPVGTTVLYESVLDRSDAREVHVTSSPAYDTINGAMVKLVGRAGGYSVEHMAATKIPQTASDGDGPCGCGGEGKGLNGFHYPYAMGCRR